MQARINNPAMILPGALKALQAVNAAVLEGGLPERTITLAHQRASEINGCEVCLAMHAPETATNDAERAAVALSEAITRLAGGEDAVSDAIWNEAARHYDERALAALVLSISMTNVWNRLNVATRQQVGDWKR